MKVYIIGPLRHDLDWRNMRELRDKLVGHGWNAMSALDDDGSVSAARANRDGVYLDDASLKIIEADQIVVMEDSDQDEMSSKELDLARAMRVVIMHPFEALTVASIVGARSSV